jgi:hypothetical protein
MVTGEWERKRLKHMDIRYKFVKHWVENGFIGFKAIGEDTGMYIYVHIYIYIVTYSGILFTMELYCTAKVNTLQLNTASNSSNTRTRPTRTVSEHSLL